MGQNTEERMVIRLTLYHNGNLPPPSMKFFNEDDEEIWLGAEVTGEQDYNTITGTVVAIEHYNEKCNTFGVRSDDPKFDGHNLDGVLKGDEGHLGWWVTNPHPLYSESDEPVIEDGAFEDFLS